MAEREPWEDELVEGLVEAGNKNFSAADSEEAMENIADPIAKAIKQGGSSGQQQSDWNETDPSKVTFIKNKPNLPSDIPSRQEMAAAIGVETTRATVAETSLQTQINGKASQEALDAEIVRAQDAESALDTRLTTAESDIDTLESGLSAETEARESADSTLQANIDNEATARENADNVLDARLDEAESDIDALQQGLADEIEDRGEADRDLQSQIDAISSKSDVVDVVASYVELLAYDTSELGDNDVIKVLRDETQDDAESYYRWHIVTSTWSLIGTQGPFVTPAEMQTELNGKVDKVTGKGLSTNDYTTAEKTKLEGIESGAEVNVNADWNANSGDAQILNKPSTFPPSSHTHTIANVSGLQTELDNLKTKDSNPETPLTYDAGRYEVVTKYLQRPASNVTALPSLSSADIGRAYKLTQDDGTHIVNHFYCRMSEDATDFTDITNYNRRYRIRLNGKSSSVRPEGLLRITLTSMYGTGNNFGSIVWNCSMCLLNAASVETTPNYLSIPWCSWASKPVSANWKFIGPCWESSDEGWYIDIINTGTYANNTNDAEIFVECWGATNLTTRPINYSTINNTDFKDYVTQVKPEIVTLPTTYKVFRNGTWETIATSTYRNVPEIPVSDLGGDKGRTEKLFHTGSTIPIANGGTGATTRIAAEYNLLGGVEDLDRTLTDTRRFAIANQTKSSTNGVFRWYSLTSLWNWIAGKISSVLGLTATNYSGKAATAGTADKATDSDKLGGQLPSYYATKSEIPDVSGKEDASNKVTTLDDSTTHYPSTSAVTTALSGKQDTISDIATIRSNAENGQTAYGWGNHADAGYATSVQMWENDEALQRFCETLDSNKANKDGSNASGTWNNAALFALNNNSFDVGWVNNDSTSTTTGTIYHKLFEWNRYGTYRRLDALLLGMTSNNDSDVKLFHIRITTGNNASSPSIKSDVLFTGGTSTSVPVAFGVEINGTTGYNLWTKETYSSSTNYPYRFKVLNVFIDGNINDKYVTYKTQTNHTTSVNLYATATNHYGHLDGSNSCSAGSTSSYTFDGSTTSMFISYNGNASVNIQVGNLNSNVLYSIYSCSLSSTSRNVSFNFVKGSLTSNFNVYGNGVNGTSMSTYTMTRTQGFNDAQLHFVRNGSSIYIMGY